MRTIIQRLHRLEFEEAANELLMKQNQHPPPLSVRSLSQWWLVRKLRNARANLVLFRTTFIEKLPKLSCASMLA